MFWCSCDYVNYTTKATDKRTKRWPNKHKSHTNTAVRSIDVKKQTFFLFLLRFYVFDVFYFVNIFVIFQYVHSKVP